LAQLLISDLRRLISQRSNLQLPLAPWESMFGQKARDYFQEEKQRVLSCLEKLRAQERVQEVSTNLVLQLVVSTWSLRNRLQAPRDRDLKPLWKTFEEIAVNYGFSQILHARLYSVMLEQLASVL